MSSHRRIPIESPRQGIMKTSTNLEQEHHKEGKHIKLHIVESRKTLSIEDDNGSISLDNN